MPERPSRGATALLALLGCLLVALLAGSCGLGGDAGDEGEATVRVGVIAIADVAPLYLGREKGFFADEDLSVEPVLAEGGAAITPAVLSGDLQFGFSNTISLLIAASQGQAVQIVASGVLGGTDEATAWAELTVRGDGAIASARDLEGATIAVNTLNNICEVTIKASLEKAGVDVATLQFTEVPIPEMNAALRSGQVDAACLVEPFVTQAEATGARGLLPFYVRTAPDLTVATYFTSRRLAREEPDLVNRFTRAMNTSLDYAQAHPGEVRRILRSYTRIPRQAVRRIKLPTWRSDINRPTIELLARLSLKYGLIERRPDLDALIRRGA